MEKKVENNLPTTPMISLHHSDKRNPALCQRRQHMPSAMLTSNISGSEVQQHKSPPQQVNKKLHQCMQHQSTPPTINVQHGSNNHTKYHTTNNHQLQLLKLKLCLLLETIIKMMDLNFGNVCSKCSSKTIFNSKNKHQYKSAHGTFRQSPWKQFNKSKYHSNIDATKHFKFRRNDCNNKWTTNGYQNNQTYAINDNKNTSSDNNKQKFFHQSSTHHATRQTQQGLQQRKYKKKANNNASNKISLSKHCLMLIALMTFITPMETIPLPSCSKLTSTTCLNNLHKETFISMKSGPPKTQYMETTEKYPVLNETWINKSTKMLAETSIVITTCGILLLIYLCQLCSTTIQKMKHGKVNKNGKLFYMNNESDNIYLNNCSNIISKQNIFNDLSMTKRRTLFSTLPTFYGRKNEKLNEFLKIFEYQIKTVDICDTTKLTLLQHCFMEKALLCSLKIMQTTNQWPKFIKELKEQINDTRRQEWDSTILKERIQLNGESLEHFAYTVIKTVNYMIVNHKQINPTKNTIMITWFKYGILHPIKNLIKNIWFKNLETALQEACDRRNQRKKKISQSRRNVLEGKRTKTQTKKLNIKNISNDYSTTIQNMVKHNHVHQKHAQQSLIPQNDQDLIKHEEPSQQSFMNRQMNSENVSEESTNTSSLP